MNVVWAWATDGREEKDRERFESQVFMPPRGEVAKTGPWSAEAEREAFGSLKDALRL